MKNFAHKLVMLKPMQADLSGYVRLQAEESRALVQLNARGLGCKAVRAFWYAGDGRVRELGAAPVNPRGEAAMSRELPRDRLVTDSRQAVLLIEDAAAPRPLMIGLCASQSADSLLDAKNASLSLCERIKRENTRRNIPEAVDGSPPEAAPIPAPVATPIPSPEIAPTPSLEATSTLPPKAAPSLPFTPVPPANASPPSLMKKAPSGALKQLSPRPSSPSRDIFLPAIDPLPYIQATEARPAPTTPPASTIPEEEPPPVSPPQRGAPVSQLPSLRWPKAFAGLREYFERLPPCGVLNLSGWRFVCVSRQENGLWIGYCQRDGTVDRVAYAMQGEPARDDGRPYQRMTGTDGTAYRVLIQRT